MRVTNSHLEILCSPKDHIMPATSILPRSKSSLTSNYQTRRFNGPPPRPKNTNINRSINRYKNPADFPHSRSAETARMSLVPIILVFLPVYTRFLGETYYNLKDRILYQQQIESKREWDRRYRLEVELRFRRKIDFARDLEYDQVRKNEQRRIEELPFWSRPAARREFEVQTEVLHKLRLSHRRWERWQRGDVPRYVLMDWFE